MAKFIAAEGKVNERLLLRIKRCFTRPEGSWVRARAFPTFSSQGPLRLLLTEIFIQNIPNWFHARLPGISRRDSWERLGGFTYDNSLSATFSWVHTSVKIILSNRCYLKPSAHLPSSCRAKEIDFTGLEGFHQDTQGKKLSNSKGWTCWYGAPKLCKKCTNE